MRISEVTKKYGFSVDTLRYYEKIGLLPSIKKNESGFRDYSADDIKWVEFIKCMRGAGLPVETLLEYINMFRQGDKTIEARKQLLIEQRNLLVKKVGNIKNTIERLDHKIESYENIILAKEKELMKYP